PAAEDRQQRLRVGGVLVTGDQLRHPAAPPAAHALQQQRGVVPEALADDDLKDQAAVGVEGGVVPLVAGEPVGLGVGVAALLLLADEGPLLIELDLGRPRGKKLPARRGASPRARRPGAHSGPPYPYRRRPGGRSGGRRSRRPGAATLPGPAPGAG